MRRDEKPSQLSAVNCVTLRGGTGRKINYFRLRIGRPEDLQFASMFVVSVKRQEHTSVSHYYDEKVVSRVFE